MKKSMVILVVVAAATCQAATKWADDLWLDRGGVWKSRVAVCVTNPTATAWLEKGVEVCIPALKDSPSSEWRVITADGLQLGYSVAGVDRLVLPVNAKPGECERYYVYFGNPSAWEPRDRWQGAADGGVPQGVASVGAVERLQIAESGLNEPWAPGDWRFRVPVRVSNFTEVTRPGAIANVPAAEICRAAIAPRFAAFIDGQRLNTFRIGETIFFSVDLPPMTSKVVWFHVADGERGESAPPTAAAASELASDIPSDQVHRAKAELADADRAAFLALARSQVNLATNPFFEDGDRGWNAPSAEGGECHVAEGGPFGHFSETRMGESANPAGWYGRSGDVAVKGGVAYVVGAFLQAEQLDNKPTVYLHLLGGEKPVHTSIAASLGTSFDWTPVFGTVQIPMGVNKMRLCLTQNGRGTLRHTGIFVAEALCGMPGAVQPRQLAADELRIAPTDPVVKVFDESEVTDCRGICSLALGRGETEDLQLAVKAGFAADLSLEVAAPVCGGVALPVETLIVRKVPVDHASVYSWLHIPDRDLRRVTGNGASDGFSGMWPDPVERGSWLALTPNVAEGVRVQVHTERETPAGKYRGEIRFRRDGVVVRALPFEVCVWDFQLPARPTFAATYDIRLDRKLWNGLSSERVMEAMAEYRMNPDKIAAEIDFKLSPTSEVTADFTEYDRAASEYFDRFGFVDSYTPGFFYLFGWGHPPRDCFGIRPYAGEPPYDQADRSQLSPEYVKVLQAAVRLYWRHVQEKGWADRIVFYLADEPFFENCPKTIIPQFKALCDAIHAVDPKIRIYSSVWKHCPQWEDCLDVWGVGAYGCFPTNEMLRLSKTGRELWFTTDGQQCLDTPYCAIERMQPLYCFAYGAVKYEFWGCTWLTQNPWLAGYHLHFKQSGLPGKKHWGRYPNGDGFLFYPSRMPGDLRPVASLRAIAVRDGVEDVEIFKQLAAARSSGKLTADLAARIDELMNDCRALVPIPNAGGRQSMTILPRPERLAELRHRAGELLQALNH